MNSSSRLLLACLLTATAMAGSALGQYQKFDGGGPYIPAAYPGGYGGYGGPGGAYGYAGDGGYSGYGDGYGAGPLEGAISSLKVPLMGPLSVSLNGNTRGLGFNGSYGSIQGTAPLFTDPLCGWWLIDARGSISEQGRPFANLGVVRRSYFAPMNADVGLGVFYDYDADKYDNFGHTFSQVGVSGHVWTQYVDLNINGYVPVGDTGYLFGTGNNTFFQNFIVARQGIDSALEGFDFDVGLRPNFLAQHSGEIHLGGYAFQGDGVDPFGGFQLMLGFQPKAGWTINTGLTTDEQFDTSGILQVAWNWGSSRGYSPSGRDLDPIRRYAHIVRAHQDPLVLTNPATGLAWRVVHVDNSAAEGGNGTFENPYNELADADGTLPAVNGVFRSFPSDIVLVREGLSRDLNGTPLDPTDDLAGDLTGYDTGFNMLAGQQLLGDGVVHYINTVEVGNQYALPNAIDGLTPFISNPNGAAVTLASGTTVSGFEIVDAQTGILAPDPSPLQNNNDGITGFVQIDRVNMQLNQPFNAVTSSVDVPFRYGLNLLDSTATYNIQQVNITAQDVILPAGTDPTLVTVQNNLVAAVNVERGAPSINFVGAIDNTFDLLLSDGADPPTLVSQGTRSIGGQAVRFADTTGGNSVFRGLIRNDQGGGVEMDTNLNMSVAFRGPIIITDPNEVGIHVVDNTNSIFEFLDINITTPINAAVYDADPTDVLPNQPVAGFIADRNDNGLIRASGLIDIVGGPALIAASTDTQNLPIDMVFSRLRSRGSLDGGVELSNTLGNFRSNETIVRDSQGTAILVAGSDVQPLNANFGQTLIDVSTDAAGLALNTQGSGVILNDNPLALIRFTTLNVTTTNGLGFQAIDSGTVNLVTAPIINATGGAAVDIENTRGLTNGQSGWTFERLTSTASSDEGVRLVGLQDDFLVRTFTNITDNDGFGIDIQGGGDVDIDFNAVNIVSRNNVGVQIAEVAGRVRFANLDINSDLDDQGTPPTSVLDRPAGNAVNIIDTFATNGRVEILGGTIRDAINDGIHIENSIVTVQDVNINVSADDLETDNGISVWTTGTGSSIVLLQDNVIFYPDAVAPAVDVGEAGIRLLANGTGTLNATVRNNVINTNEDSLHATVNSGTLTLNAYDNSNGLGITMNDPFRLENLGGTLNVTQTSAGNLSTLNDNVPVITSGVITFGAGNPPLPPAILP